MKLTELQEKWLAELESGKHKQAKRYLFDGCGYCCLGVACRFVFGIEPSAKEHSDKKWFQTESNVLPHPISNELGLFSSAGDLRQDLRQIFKEVIEKEGFFNPNSVYSPISLAAYNDTGATFAQIAAAIRKLPEAVFNNPA